MSMNILGISAYYHDSAAALLVDGNIVAAAQEERFTRKKHDKEFPSHAIDYCLLEAGLNVSDLNHVVFYEKPFLHFERLLETYLGVAPTGFPSFLKAIPQWVHQKLYLPREFKKKLRGEYQKAFAFTSHHESHAASAFFPSPFEEAAILTLDGVGEWTTSSMGRGSKNRIELTHELQFPHSLGLLYSAFTYFCGFKVNSGEYKLMGLAPYGTPRFEETIKQNLMDLKADGSFRLDQSYFNYCQGLTMTSPKFEKLFEGPSRSPESEITQRELDLAASVQAVTETIVLRMAQHLHEITGLKNLCLAGGVALNCVANGRLLRESPFEKIWIQPAAGDAGGALGAALFVWHQLLDFPRQVNPSDAQSGSFLGPATTDAETIRVLEERHAKFTRIDEEPELCERVAQLIEDGKVVGWVHGRMEFGPRALGGRSILGDPRHEQMQQIINQKIKFRESFRPFAPIVKKERAAEFFELNPDEESPYMLIVAPVRQEQRKDSSTDSRFSGLDKVRAIRSNLPAITHVDFSARVQTVDADRSPRMHRLLSAFEDRTGCPVLINTSFNIRGEPIVCSADDAFRCFMATDMDVLIIDNFLLLKSEQTAVVGDERTSYLARFGND